jgi:hypothetical protein
VAVSCPNLKDALRSRPPRIAPVRCVRCQVGVKRVATARLVSAMGTLFPVTDDASRTPRPAAHQRGTSEDGG